MAEAHRVPSRLGRIGFRIAFLLVLAALLLLGTWQVQRLHWKESLIAERAARMNAPPVPIDELVNRMTASLPDEPGQLMAPTDPEFVPVTVTGTFDHAHEMFFLATLDGEPGYNLYVPLKIGDDRWVIVNRGFVPEPLRDPAKRRDGQPQGQVTITGLAREILTAKPGSLVPDNDKKAKLYFWKDWPAMVAEAGLKPNQVVRFFVDAGPSAAGVWPKGGITIIDLPNNHLQYALTWYGLAIALVGVGIAMRLRNRPKG